MFITINGQLGSGKTEICRILRDEYGYEVFHTGKIQREYAKELGISTLELNELCNKDHKYDDIIDGKLVEYGEKKRGEDVVFDSRMAWHFVKDTFKIHLLVSPEIAAERVFAHRVDAAEKYTCKDDAMRGLINRRKVEADRYKRLYHVDMIDYRNYDLVLDTSLTSIRQEVNIIVEALKEFQEKGTKKMLSAPTSLFPTGLEIGGEGVKVVKCDESLYIVNGHDLVKEALNKCNLVMPVELVAQDGEMLNENLTVEQASNTTLADLEKWCKPLGFEFGFIPCKVINNSK